jgi:hypothetical protein
LDFISTGCLKNLEWVQQYVKKVMFSACESSGTPGLTSLVPTVPECVSAIPERRLHVPVIRKVAPNGHFPGEIFSLTPGFHYRRKPPGGVYHHISGAADCCMCHWTNLAGMAAAIASDPAEVPQSPRVFECGKAFDPPFFASFWLLGGACHAKKKARDRKSVRGKAM